MCGPCQSSRPLADLFRHAASKCSRWILESCGAKEGGRTMWHRRTPGYLTGTTVRPLLQTNGEADGIRAVRRVRARMGRKSPVSQRRRAMRAFQRLPPSARFLRRSSAVEDRTVRRPRRPIGRAATLRRSTWGTTALLLRASGVPPGRASIQSAAGLTWMVPEVLAIF